MLFTIVGEFQQTGLQGNFLGDGIGLFLNDRLFDGFVLQLFEREVAQSIEFRRQDAGLTGSELVIPFAVNGKGSEILHDIAALLAQLLLQHLDLAFYTAQSLRIADVVSLHVRLSQHGVVHSQLRIEP